MSVIRTVSAGSALALLVVCWFAADSVAEDWPFWRGPNRNGVAETTSAPTEWSESKNILWKAPVPGRGHSSPTVVGDRIYMASADERNQAQYVLAFNRADGASLWQTKISEGGFPKTHQKNTHATCTIAWDGERMFVAFHHNRKVTLTALSRDGDILWTKDVGRFDPQLYEYGYAPSPVIHGDSVIVAADYEGGGHLTAFERESGARKWQTPRPKFLSFSSPVIAGIAGRDQLLISGGYQVASYDPETGKELWSVEGTTMATCGTIVWDGDAVFASGGYPDRQTIAVQADGSRRILWTNQQKCYEQSMLAHDGYVYAVTDNGIGFCWRASDGETMWETRLTGRPVSASPVLVGDNIYLSDEYGTTFVFKADPSEFTLVSKNQLGQEGFATPAFVDGRIYLRTATGERGARQEYLYCIGER